MTIHITPEPECSYVSFESNVPIKSYSGLIQRVINTFQPEKFIVNIFANRVIYFKQSQVIATIK
jgi:S-adenosylmethionine decarboxylase